MPVELGTQSRVAKGLPEFTASLTTTSTDQSSPTLYLKTQSLGFYHPENLPLCNKDMRQGWFPWIILRRVLGQVTPSLDRSRETPALPVREAFLLKQRDSFCRSPANKQNIEYTKLLCQASAAGIRTSDFKVKWFHDAQTGLQCYPSQ